MDKLSDIISKKFNQGGFSKVAKPAWVCYEISKRITYDDCQAVSYKEGVVTLEACDYIQASILKMNKKSLVKDFNSWLKSKEIKDIRIVVSRS